VTLTIFSKDYALENLILVVTCVKESPSGKLLQIFKVILGFRLLL
jgi:hypothetical protein